MGSGQARFDNTQGTGPGLQYPSDFLEGAVRVFDRHMMRRAEEEHCAHRPGFRRQTLHPGFDEGKIGRWRGLAVLLRLDRVWLDAQDGAPAPTSSRDSFPGPQPTSTTFRPLTALRAVTAAMSIHSPRSVRMVSVME